MEAPILRSPFKRTNDGDCPDDSPRKRYRSRKILELNQKLEINSSIENLSPRKIRSLSMYEPKTKESYAIR